MVGGILQLVETFGIPLDITLRYLWERNMVPDWKEMLDYSISIKWNRSTFYNKCEFAVRETYPRDDVDLILERIKILIMGQ